MSPVAIPERHSVTPNRESTTTSVERHVLSQPLSELMFAVLVAFGCTHKSPQLALWRLPSYGLEPGLRSNRQIR